MSDLCIFPPSIGFRFLFIRPVNYDRFKDVKQIGRHGFGTIHYARLMNIHSSPRVPSRKYFIIQFKNSLWISDFGLSKLIGINPNIPVKKNIFGVLPYIAPEALSGEEYTSEEFSTNQKSTTTTTPFNYQTHPQAIYTSWLLNYSNLLKPKNEENFEKELEELTKSIYFIININLFLYYLGDSGIVDLDMRRVQIQLA
ncbi:hypothetical protein Glove_173g43 [Diversispora epigaea]|uniref:Protein kinase domain-containing protein n=1 Tax=Diversispora epigaea TaxID=1348612 RepID=A0A397IS35_9GLOM|nr:hypothetical protein Glove_173g43 [Diversispora epigaea]